MKQAKILLSTLFLIFISAGTGWSENQYSKFLEYYQNLKNSREVLGLSDITARLERNFSDLNFKGRFEPNPFYSSFFSNPWNPFTAYTDLKVNTDTFPATLIFVG